VFYSTRPERCCFGKFLVRYRNCGRALTDTTPVSPVAHRIAHILAWPIVAGTEILTLRIAKGLSGPEFQHLAFCTTEALAVESFFRAARRPGPFLKASFGLARQLRRHRVALVHCSDLMSGLRAAPAAKLARLPVVCHIRNPEPTQPGLELGHHQAPRPGQVDLLLPLRAARDIFSR
jgi:hypothetical protein